MIDVDSSQVDNLLDKLDDDDLRRGIIFKAVKAGAKVLQNTTKNYFKSSVGAAASHTSPYIKAPFYEGVIMKGDRAYLEARVSIMKDFRMKFFEKGTTQRQTKKGYNRGSMVGKYFFKSAVESSQGSIEAAIQKSIENSLSKL
jgi:hypothetical protein